LPRVKAAFNAKNPEHKTKGRYAKNKGYFLTNASPELASRRQVLVGRWVVLGFWHSKIFSYKREVVPISGMIAQGKELASNHRIFGDVGVIFDCR
jgi:hypothetical protein